MTDRYGSFLYPPEFVERLPRPAAHETRPLLLLLRGEHSNGDAEIERIERWFRELDGPDDRKAALAGNLRSPKPRQFWSALSELMTSRVFVELGCRPRFEVAVAGVTPDFAVRSQAGVEFPAEVLTAFEEKEYAEADADLHYVASALAGIQHRVAVFIDDVDLPATRPSMKPMLGLVQAWLETCRPGEASTLSLTAEEIGFALTVSTAGVRERPSAIVTGIVGQGGKIETHETIRAAIGKKVNRYRYVKEVGLPLVVFVWQGTWMHVSNTPVEWALFGQDQVTFTRARGGGLTDAQWGRAPGGLFGFGRDGASGPENTRVSAVVYGEREPRSGSVYARLRVYQHPFAATPLPRDLFAGIPQLVPVKATAGEVVVEWNGEPGGALLLLR